MHVKKPCGGGGGSGGCCCCCNCWCSSGIVAGDDAAAAAAATATAATAAVTGEIEDGEIGADDRVDCGGDTFGVDDSVLVEQDKSNGSTCSITCQGKDKKRFLYGRVIMMVMVYGVGIFRWDIV